jgi:hypothetical protein
MFIEHAEAAIAVAKRDKVFAQRADACRRAVGFGNFFGQARGQPMPPHQLAHRCVAFDAAQEFVFFGGQHGFPPGAQASA